MVANAPVEKAGEEPLVGISADDVFVFVEDGFNIGDREEVDAPVGGFCAQ